MIKRYNGSGNYDVYLASSNKDYNFTEEELNEITNEAVGTLRSEYDLKLEKVNMKYHRTVSKASELSETNKIFTQTISDIRSACIGNKDNEHDLLKEIVKTLAELDKRKI